VVFKDVTYVSRDAVVPTIAFSGHPEASSVPNVTFGNVRVHRLAADGPWPVSRMEPDWADEHLPMARGAR